MRKQHRDLDSRALIAGILLGLSSAMSLFGQNAGSPMALPLAESPYHRFGPAREILAGVILRDEADDPALREGLTTALSWLSAELVGRQGWPSPYSAEDPLRIFVTRTDAAGQRRLSSRSVDRRRLRAPAIEIDGSSLSNSQILGEASRLFALAAISAYGVRDSSFLTSAAADLLSGFTDPGSSADVRRRAAAAPTVRLADHPQTLGRELLEEFERSAGGRGAVRLVWERASDRGEEPLASLARVYAEKTGAAEDTLLLRFAARLYSTVETDPGPSAIGRWDLEAGALDAGAPEAWTLLHRTYLPSEAAGALKFSWPVGAAHGAAVVRYRDADLPPDVVVLEPGSAHALALSGVARVDWVLAGSATAGPPSAVFFEPTAAYPFAGLQPHAVSSSDGVRVWWTTASHEDLGGWALFREEVLPDGRIVRIGPEIVPASNESAESFRYAYLDAETRPGTYYRYTIWAVTGEGLLTKAFSATLRTPE
jgi:hypothetical protein